MGGDLLLDVLSILGSQEQHVLHKMGHAGFAVSFMAGTHQIGDVNGNLRLRLVGEQEHAQAIWISILRDAFDRCHSLDARRQRLRERRQCYCAYNSNSL